MAEKNNGYASCELHGRRGFGTRTLNMCGESRRGCSCSRCAAREQTAVMEGEDRRGHSCLHGGSLSGVGNTNGCGCGRDRDDRPRTGRGECCGLMNQLQQLDFSIQETVLYLDAYPDCAAALAYYHQLVAERARVAAEYEQGCGPLNAYGNACREEWGWVSNPWPWQVEFPGNGMGKQG